MNGPDPVSEVCEYRRAARMIVRATDTGTREKCAALLRLRSRAAVRSSMARWLERAIWAEARPFLEPDADPVPMPEPIELAARALRARGYAACPSCRRDLFTEDDFTRWAAMRSARAAETAAFEGAVA